MPNDHLNKKIEDAMQSFDGSVRATPRPYLLTRIHARMQVQAETIWDKAAKFITRPVVAFAGLCAIIGVNFLIVTASENSNAAKERSSENYSANIATLYYNETTEP